VRLHGSRGKWEARIRYETGKELYLGSFEREEQAARAHDRAAIKLNKQDAVLNFPLPEGELEHLTCILTEDLVAELRRQSTGITRGNNKFRGVYHKEKSGTWKAEIYGLLGRKKNAYLGTFETSEEAAEAYDRAAIIRDGPKAITNFNLEEYEELLAWVKRASPEECRAMAERLAQGDSAGALMFRGRHPIAKGRKKAGSKRKASKPDLGATRAGGVQKRKAKTKAKRSAGSPASKPKPEPEEVEICKLEWPARRVAVDTPAAKRPKAAPSAAQLQQAEALEDLREAELKIDGLVAKSAQQERLIAHLERSNALLLEENEDLRWFLANAAVEA